VEVTREIYLYFVAAGSHWAARKVEVGLIANSWTQDAKKRTVTGPLIQ